ncbi:unnamed protein product [Caenorhabditis angaria]|uniref:Uncharacterized protein n=1 Tax=Caenorhabditis angaria TaxID=860376 RepID=A0A9P1ILR1_9PELO|nr:unnamed protein product [Caenorhabditis angaria]
MRICFQLLFLLYFIFIKKSLQKAAYLRDRPRGLGLLQIPTGISDERSKPFFPNLSIAGNKIGNKPQTVPDISLPGQTANFTGLSSFHPFTHILSATYTEDLSDSWGSGFAVNGANTLGLNVRKNFDSYADLPLNINDGLYQPFILTSMIGGEYDLSKVVELSGSLDLPIPGLNEIFDLDGRYMNKVQGLINTALEFPLTLTDPNERGLYTFKYVNFSPDRHAHYGHVVPNVNLFVVGKDKIMDRLMRNNLNPTLLG